MVDTHRESTHDNQKHNNSHTKKKIRAWHFYLHSIIYNTSRGTENDLPIFKLTLITGARACVGRSVMIMILIMTSAYERLEIIYR